MIYEEGKLKFLIFNFLSWKPDEKLKYFHWNIYIFLFNIGIEFWIQSGARLHLLWFDEFLNIVKMKVGNL